MTKILLDFLFSFLFFLNCHKICSIPISSSIRTILCLIFSLLVNFFFINIGSSTTLSVLSKSFITFLPFFIKYLFKKYSIIGGKVAVTIAILPPISIILVIPKITAASKLASYICISSKIILE